MPPIKVTENDKVEIRITIGGNTRIEYYLLCKKANAKEIKTVFDSNGKKPLTVRTVDICGCLVKGRNLVWAQFVNVLPDKGDVKCSGSIELLVNGESRLKDSYSKNHPSYISNDFIIVL